jgi:hypothetical protein
LGGVGVLWFGDGLSGLGGPGLIVGSPLLVLVVFGRAFRWGLVVPSSLLGIVLALLLTLSILSLLWYDAIMNLTLHLSGELEARLCEQVQATGKAPEDLALEALQDRLTGEAVPLSYRTCIAEFEAWLASHPPSAARHLDDSRESIYEGRGE